MNALGKLNETLLSTLDRIADGELQGEELDQELNRAGSIVKVGELTVKQIDLLRAYFVDSFAGGGGASTGIERATGHPIDIAINHDQSTIRMHKLTAKFADGRRDPDCGDEAAAPSLDGIMESFLKGLDGRKAYLCGRLLEELYRWRFGSDGGKLNAGALAGMLFDR